MKATELRIGNYIDRGDCICTVETLDRKGATTTPIGSNYDLDKKTGLNPIPLTEEWLLKFGFKKEKNVNENTYPDFRKRSVELLTNVNGFYVLNRNEGFTDIHYLHQLQNLYYALTGEELTLTSNEDKL